MAVPNVEALACEEPLCGAMRIRVGIPCDGEVRLGSASEAITLRVCEGLELSHALFRPAENGSIACVGPDGACTRLSSPVVVGLDEGVSDAGNARSSLIWLDDRKAVHKGWFELSVNADGDLSLANIVDLEDYVAGVVPYEIGAFSPFEALRAQAVVARTEALSRLGRHGDEGYDLCSTTHCQVYKGAGAELAYPAVREAVDSTAGEVLFHGGIVARGANYHACCGGLTESEGDLWGTDVPYMHTVRCGRELDSTGDGLDMSEEDEVRRWIQTPDPDDYCYGSNGYRWRVEYSQETLAGILEPVIGLDASVESLEVVARTSRGAAVRLVVHASSGDYEVSGEYAIRAALGGTQVIKSGVFVVSSDGNPPTKFEFEGAGYGHGVGMCQYGARAMALEGHDYISILEKYYPGATVGSLKP
jgi:SpoIID/LytB domain protein